MLSAYQARRMMPSEKVTKLVEYVLSGVPARAKNGHYNIMVGVPADIYTDHDIEVAEKQLNKLGYYSKRRYYVNSLWLFVSWCE